MQFEVTGTNDLAITRMQEVELMIMDLSVVDCKVSLHLTMLPWYVQTL